MNPINVLMATGTITKTVTLVTTFHKPAGKENPYVWFGYGPLTICYHTQGKVSGSMNANPINKIHTSQQSTKEVPNKELEGYLRPRDNPPQITILNE